MCGILGQINKNGEIDKQEFKSMLATLQNRGPDDQGIFYDENVALGHQRLSVIDLSQRAKQPMANEDGNVVLVFNGEIYNYKELQKEIGDGHVWKSDSDSEVLIHGYEKWGVEELLSKIEGMFSFAIFDKKENKIFLVRDHFGKKPLNYFFDGQVFAFASEPKALLRNSHIKSKQQIDQNSLAMFLVAGYIPSPNSIFNNLKKLQPASFLEFDIANWQLGKPNKFWDLTGMIPADDFSESELLYQIENGLKEAVKKRLVSDAPLGIFLSGGLDSSVASALAVLEKPNLVAYTIEYGKKDDESIFASQAAGHLGLKQEKIRFGRSEIADSFLEMMDYLDEPLCDAAMIPLHFLSKKVSGKAKVVLGGDGGDEIFAGYEKYRAQVLIEKYNFLGFTDPVAKHLFSKNNPRRKLFKAFNLPFCQRQLVFGSGGFLPGEIGELLIGQARYDYEKNPDFFRNRISVSGKDTINKSLYLDCQMQIPDWYMQKTDRATMAASLEMRSPLLDKNLAELMFSVPGSLKMKNGQKKYLLKKIAEKYLPRELVYRKKSGFQAPMGKWIRNELKDVFSQYILEKSDHFNEKYVRKLYNEHMGGRCDHSHRLLRIFIFNYWKKKYFG